MIIPSARADAGAVRLKSTLATNARLKDMDPPSWLIGQRRRFHHTPSKVWSKHKGMIGVSGGLARLWTSRFARFGQQIPMPAIAIGRHLERFQRQQPCLADR